METEKDRFGEKMRLVERAKEDIYFAEKDRELIEKLKARLAKVERAENANVALVCPKCRGKLETYSFMEFILERCTECEGVWLDKGELEGILKKVTRSPLALFVERFLGKEEAGQRKERK